MSKKFALRITILSVLAGVDLFLLSEFGDQLRFPSYESIPVVSPSPTSLSVELPEESIVATLAPSPKPAVKKTQPADTRPWGVAQQIDDVTWTMKIGEDERMATPQETLQALNAYRERHSAGPLTWDDRLASFASDRAKHLNFIKTTDKHKGFIEYVESEDNVRALGFWSLGENSGYGYKLIGVHQIEWIYASDEGHNKNQLNTAWSHVGIGIQGLAVVFIFGGSKI